MAAAFEVSEPLGFRMFYVADLMKLTTLQTF